MKKIAFFIIGLSVMVSTAYAADDPYLEDFESYNDFAVYNSEDLVVSYPGYENSNVTGRYIINGKGGIYSDDEAYTANAAENIYCYAKTGDGTADLVFGGLNNGWHGAYSHPPTSLNCQGGAGGELNPWNRKLAVVSVSGNKVLQMNPNDNGYVNTYSIYANDDVDFYEHSRWSTDVYIDNAYSGGYFDIVLSTGKMSAIQPLAYLPSIANGRLEILDFIKFHDDGTIFCLEEAVTTYQKKTWYTVELSIDQNEGGPQFNFRLIQKSNGECLFETGETDLPFSIEDDAAGIGYTAFTSRGNNATNVYVDNIVFEKVDFYAVSASNRDVSINGKGSFAIKFNGEYDESTISNDTIKVFLGDEEIAADVSCLSQNRVRIALPVLLPAHNYRIVVDGVVGLNGIKAKCEVPFKTVSHAAINTAAINGTDVSVTLKNNSVESLHTTAVAVCEDENGVLLKLAYMPITLDDSAQQEQTFSGIVTEDTATVSVYLISGFSKGIRPISDFKVLTK